MSKSLWLVLVLSTAVPAVLFSQMNMPMPMPSDKPAAMAPAAAAAPSAAVIPAPGLTPLQRLGKAIFFDPDLSNPFGQSCSSCHDPLAGFSERESASPVSKGAVSGRVGNRNAPSVSYAMFSPALHYDAAARPGIMEGMYVGGYFWDGRAATLEEQAKGPFLNPLEMNNPDAASVVASVKKAIYADNFTALFGPRSLDATDAAFTHVAEALAAYMRSREVNPFTSKYDAWKAGKAQLTPSEMSGYTLFTGAAKCSNCHTEPYFTNFGYQNVGAPKNAGLPYYSVPAPLNPNGAAFVDRGLGGYLRGIGMPEAQAAKEDGKFKIPTLRNAALTAPYEHNGVFKTLRDVVRFNNTRDVPGAGWPAAETAQNVHRHLPPMQGTFGQLGLSDREIDDIVAFLQTLTDGYTL